MRSFKCLGVDTEITVQLLDIDIMFVVCAVSVSCCSLSQTKTIKDPNTESELYK